MNKISTIEMIKLLWNINLWEMDFSSRFDFMDDVRKTKDDRYYIFSDVPMTLRDYKSGEVQWECNFIVFLLKTFYKKLWKHDS